MLLLSVLVEIVAALLLLLSSFLLFLHSFPPLGLTLLIGRSCSLLIFRSDASLAAVAHFVPFSTGFFSSLLEFVVDSLRITNKSWALLAKLDCTRRSSPRFLNVLGFSGRYRRPAFSPGIRVESSKIGGKLQIIIRWFDTPSSNAKQNMRPRTTSRMKPHIIVSSFLETYGFVLTLIPADQYLQTRR